KPPCSRCTDSRSASSERMPNSSLRFGLLRRSNPDRLSQRSNQRMAQAPASARRNLKVKVPIWIPPLLPCPAAFQSQNPTILPYLLQLQLLAQKAINTWNTRSELAMAGAVL